MRERFAQSTAWRLSTLILLTAESFFHQLIDKLSKPLVLFGILGQGIFMMRFVWQWYVSERIGRSVIPLGFWYLSILGGLITLAYAIVTIEPVLLMAQSLALPIYLRNLYLIHREKTRLADLEDGAKKEMEGLAVAREEPSI